MKLNDLNDIMKKSFGERYINIQSDPTEFNEPEAERCQRCDNDILTLEEIDEKMCFECMEELDIQDENSNSRNLANER
tara:strand:- start:166 stop:399 length:234 start_codon:yes stop_codon:yes gene_type:complete